MPLPMEPCSLRIVARNRSMANALLEYPVGMEEKDNVAFLTLGDGSDSTKIKVPEKCIDFLAVTIYQLEVFRRTADVLLGRPDVDVKNPDIQFYLALISYAAEIITSFVTEVREAGDNIRQSKWRSAILDYHIALTLENSAFTSTHQRLAEQKMNRTWAQFREKKLFKKIQSMTHVHLHNALCSDGDDACGGPFDHTRDIDEVVKATIVHIDAMRAAASSTVVAEPADVACTHTNAVGDDVTAPALIDAPNANAKASADAQPIAIDDEPHNPSEGRVTEQPKIKIKIKATAIKTNTGQASSTKSEMKSKPSGKKARRNATAEAAGSSKHILDAESEDEVDHGERIADAFERLLVERKPVKSRKTKNQPKSKKGKGKQKAAPKVLVANSEDEISDVPSTARTFPSAIVDDDDPPSPTLVSATWRTDLDMMEDIPEIRPDTRPVDRGGLNDDPLPVMLDDWDTWHRTAFERGRSQVFLKLATWMLIRFRQLTMTDMDADVNGVIIPLNPRTIPFVDHDDFLEALGMERLYSAIVNMDTRPRFLSHLFHALGTISHDADIGHSNHGSQAISSPPPVIASMMADVDVPWLHLSGSDRPTYLVLRLQPSKRHPRHPVPNGDGRAVSGCPSPSLLFPIRHFLRLAVTPSPLLFPISHYFPPWRRAVRPSALQTSPRYPPRREGVTPSPSQTGRHHPVTLPDRKASPRHPPRRAGVTLLFSHQPLIFSFGAALSVLQGCKRHPVTLPCLSVTLPSPGVTPSSTGVNFASPGVTPRLFWVSHYPRVCIGHAGMVSLMVTSPTHSPSSTTPSPLPSANSKPTQRSRCIPEDDPTRTSSHSGLCALESIFPCQVQ
ncbi:hypothetical protein DEU56DRAFT_918153 [Suillus clintonianus]|uniref:uncharacterized protein n=1 Tax=Suillus clintonianus TaxID=1904413 RepID=UPI001B86070C|nr:uncharacterized protein DEU56DRAFT_918153 [Suillus clintonianus]KAG2121466.1 hypothetical protein DEU56DRAFT_918153 [Suillus clintonianus]